MTALRVCVLGGGTAGFMAAAHVSRWFPQAALTHVFDSRIPTIGVGEGTTPPFRAWLHETTGLSFDALERRCHATIKQGIRFENWGEAHGAYRHWFSEREGLAYHVSAAKIVEVLAERVEAERLNARVDDVVSDGREAQVIFEGGEIRRFDLVLDARGFPKAGEAGIRRFDAIPTNAALLRRAPPQPAESRHETRAIARPHGWIFVIPLTQQTSWGYVHHADDAAQAEADFDAVLAAEGVAAEPLGRRLSFPNFRRETLFDGAHMRIGNAASFLEPLEATAIMVATYQLRLVSGWLFLRQVHGRPPPGAADTLNDAAGAFIDEAAHFIAWHYACGAPWDTPFWRRARARWADADAALAPPPRRDAFDRFVAAGGRLPPRLAFVQAREELATLERAEATDDAFGGFLTESFAKVGHGMGRYAVPA
ncbi:MAG: tryptophan 7-halogenase [Pseudomonadota bacterium]